MRDSAHRASTPLTHAILQRRSIRSGFATEPLERQVIDEIVACGLAAPSSKNSMPWRFHCVTSRQLLGQFADLMVGSRGRLSYVPHDPTTGLPRPEYTSTVVDSSDVLRAVPLAIFIENLGPFSRGLAGLVSANEEWRASALFGYGLEMLGVGAAVENMWLAASALGLSAAMLGDVAIAEQEIKARLDFRGDLVGVLAVGASHDPPYPPMDAPAMSEVARVVHHAL